MRHNSCTVIVLASPAPAEVLGTVGRSMNVTLVPPAEPDPTDGASGVGGPAGVGAPQRLAAAADALRRAASAPSAYALVTADPLAAVADGWRAWWDRAQPQGPARFEQEAAPALAAWRAGRFELPDYYLVTATEPADDQEQNFYLCPLRAARSHRVAFVPAAEPAEQAAGVLSALGSLRHGPWWPSLDDLLQTARTFYPGHLSETTQATLATPVTPAAR